MQQDNIGISQQVFQAGLLHIPGKIMMGRAVMGQDGAANPMEQLGASAPDLSHSNNANGLSLQFIAHQAILRPSGTAAALNSSHVPAQRKGHAQCQLRHGFIGIARRIAELHSHFLCRSQIHMVNAGECHINILQIFASTDYFTAKGHIGDHQCIRILRFLNQSCRIRGFGVFIKDVPLGLKRPFQLLHFLFRHRKGFQNNNFTHATLPF